MDRIVDTPTEWDLWEDERFDATDEKLMRASTLLGMKAGSD